MTINYEYDKANFDVSKLSVEEIERRLRAMGFPVGSWEAPESDDDTVIKTLPTFQKQALLLQKLQELLGMQIADDQKTINNLAEKRQRLLHGGGR
jgi:hypothetical protein